MLECSKDNISRWTYNPCGTQRISKNAKLNVIKNVATLFKLTQQESESLANKAGLSLFKRENGLAELMKLHTGKLTDLLEQASVSERMFQYYIAGKEPTKQALLAITVLMGLTLEDIDILLRKYGYCLSRSLPNDAVVIWFLENEVSGSKASLLYSINTVLEELGLPILMTKIYRR